MIYCGTLFQKLDVEEGFVRDHRKTQQPRDPVRQTQSPSVREMASSLINSLNKE